MAIVDDFPAIRAAMERNQPAEPKHPLLLDVVIRQQREQLAKAWRQQLDNGMFANFPGSMFAKKGNTE